MEKEEVLTIVKRSVFFLVLILLIVIFYCACLNHVGINEVGVAYNSIGGKVWIQDRPGWYFTSPTVEVAVIPTIPMKVEIPSEAKVINIKIVRFNPKGIDEFIRLQGFSYFSDQGVQNILMGYAFTGKDYPFLDILQGAGTENDALPALQK